MGMNSRLHLMGSDSSGICYHIHYLKVPEHLTACATKECALRTKVNTHQNQNVWQSTNNLRGSVAAPLPNASTDQLAAGNDHAACICVLQDPLMAKWAIVCPLRAARISQGPSTTLESKLHMAPASKT
jgi:hypothetical protein